MAGRPLLESQARSSRGELRDRRANDISMVCVRSDDDRRAVGRRADLDESNGLSGLEVNQLQRRWGAADSRQVVSVCAKHGYARAERLHSNRLLFVAIRRAEDVDPAIRKGIKVRPIRRTKFNASV